MSHVGLEVLEDDTDFSTEVDFFSTLGGFIKVFEALVGTVLGEEFEEVLLVGAVVGLGCNDALLGGDFSLSLYFFLFLVCEFGLKSSEFSSHFVEVVEVSINSSCFFMTEISLG